MLEVSTLGWLRRCGSSFTTATHRMVSSGWELERLASSPLKTHNGCSRSFSLTCRGTQDLSSVARSPNTPSYDQMPEPAIRVDPISKDAE